MHLKKSTFWWNDPNDTIYHHKNDFSLFIYIVLITLPHFFGWRGESSEEIRKKNVMTMVNVVCIQRMFFCWLFFFFNTAFINITGWELILCFLMLVHAASVLTTIWMRFLWRKKKKKVYPVHILEATVCLNRYIFF